MNAVDNIINSNVGGFLGNILNITPEALNIIKLGAICLGLFHFLVGMYIIYQIFKMRDIVRIESDHHITAYCVAYIIILLSVIFLAIIF